MATMSLAELKHAVKDVRLDMEVYIGGVQDGRLKGNCIAAICVMTCADGRERLFIFDRHQAANLEEEWGATHTGNGVGNAYSPGNKN